MCLQLYRKNASICLRFDLDNGLIFPRGWSTVHVVYNEGQGSQLCAPV